MTSAYPGRDSGGTPDPRPESLTGQVLYPEWAPIIAGAIAASALALVLHAFASAMGFSVSSTAPTWRDASFALVALSGLYVFLAALASYGLGGYLAGLMGERLTSRENADLRDGLHGLLVWALATLLTALIGLATVQSLTRLGAPSGGQAGPSTSVGGENLIAFDLDRLFRAERRSDTDLEYPRAEAARILLTTSSHRGMQPEDRGYLVRLTSAMTGLAQPDAERRVDEVAPARRKISPVPAGVLWFWHSRPERQRYLALLLRGSRPVLADAYGTAKLRLTRCWIGEGQQDALEQVRSG
jgi:hypothetical protein